MKKSNPAEDISFRRRVLVEKLKDFGAIKSHLIEEAFLAVPRHRYLEGIVDPAEAYADRAVNLKWGVSTASQPQVMALMLEALDPFPGMNVLEIGTASGYNAALLARIAGENGLVVTLEIEGDLARRAEELLNEDFPGRVEVVIGDGWKGYPEQAPYDRIIITAETPNVSEHLFNQLDEGGRIVLPLKIDFRLTVLTCLVKKGRELQGGFFGFPVNFVPMRGKEEVPEPEEVNSSEIIFSGLGWRLWRMTLEEQAGLILFQKAYGLKDAHKIYEGWREAGSPGLQEFKIKIKPSDGWIIDLEE